MRKILIAGASGFIGHALIESLLTHDDLQIVGLSRSSRSSLTPQLEWRKCDLFSLKDITEAMEGCTEAYYLVHSMLPSASLSQGEFYDFDLIMADNFVRAALVHQLKHIIYLGGIIPPMGQLSWHLRSRLEVEQTLRNSPIPTTALRAGLIIGKHGPSFTILERLIKRLPLMICPAWTNTRSQPLALGDAISVLVRCLFESSVQGKVYDIGGPEIITYQGLIELAANMIKRKRHLLTINIIPLGLSRMWVSVITGIPKKLVYPLVLSLKHEMLVDEKKSWPFKKDLKTKIDVALKSSLSNDEATGPTFKGHVPVEKDVRSIQRLVLPTNHDAQWVALEYFNWLPTFFSSLIRVKLEGEICSFYLFDPSIRLLILERSTERSSPDRQLLYIIGGLLAAKQERGRLEFREVLEKKYVMAAIHEFRPALPWFIYRFTQAIVHLIVMKAFGEHLKWMIISDKKKVNL